jgi:hypothetical protein
MSLKSCRGILPLKRQAHNRERRKWHRLPLALPVFLRSIGSDGKESLEFATGLNVSAGGILVATRRALPLAMQALLEIPVAPFTLPAKAPKTTRKLSAKIVRIVHGEEFHLIGMRFQRPLTATAMMKPAIKKVVRRKRSSTV